MQHAFRLSPDQVHVFWAHSGLADREWLGMLNDDERSRFAGYRLPADRARFLTGAVLVRCLMAADLKVDVGAVQLARTCPDCDQPHGKVTLVASGVRPEARIEVSVSHSGDWVVVAACRGRALGVDVEEVRPEVEREDVGRLFLSEAELHELTMTPEADRADHMTRSWVRKEALLKSTGEGLRTPMTDLDLSQVDHEPVVVAWPTHAEYPHRALLQDLTCASDHRAAVAVTGSAPARVVHRDAARLVSVFR